MPHPRKIRPDRPADCLFSKDHADRAVRFFNEHCRHTKGRWYGQPFNARPWQEIDIREIYGRVDEYGNRVIRQVYKEIPKKNGKSEECAGHANKLLFADDEPGAEIYGAAADRDQASIIFDVAAQMVQLDPVLLKAAGGRKGIIDSRKRIVNPDWNSFYRVVSAEVGGKHGFNSHGVIFDEVHAQKDSRLWEVLTFGVGAARLQPLTIAITTAGVPGESPVAEALHEDADQILRGVIPCPPSFYPIIYAAPDDADWTDPEVWRAANPAYGDFLSEQSVLEEFDIARRRPSEQNSFRRLRLNQWVSQTTRWIDLADWDACRGSFELRDLKHLTWYGGLDLSTKLDVTAFVLTATDENGVVYILEWFWIPRDNMKDRPNVEAEKYRIWEKQGLITATPGSEVDYNSVREKINLLSRDLDITEIGFDRKFATQLAQQLTEDGFTLTDVPQTHTHLTEAYNEIESAIIQRRFRHQGHPVMRWMMDCVDVNQRSDGAIKIVKPSRLKSRKRVDGPVAMGIAMSRRVAGEQTAVTYSGIRVAG